MTTQERIEAFVSRAQEIVAKVEREGRKITDAEREECQRLIARAQELKDEEQLRDQINRLRAGPNAVARGGFAKAVVDAGFDLKTKPAVEIPSHQIFAASTFPGEETWRVDGPTIAPLWQDRRWLFSNLPTQNVEGASAVQDFRQSVRTLTGNAVRDLDATTDKATLDVTLTNVVESLKQVAVTIDAIPNSIFESVSSMRAYLNQEGAFQVQKALDTHVLSQIVAAAPPFGTSGTGLVARIRNGVATMRATGANPSLVVLNPTDAATLDLEADAGGYIFPTRDTGTSSPCGGSA
jgi:hypothetical protein